MSSLNHSSKKKKLVFITSRFPYPLEKGDKLRAFYQIKHLSTDFEITLLALSEKKVSQADCNKLINYCSKIVVFEIKTWQKYFGVFLGLWNDQPFQVNYFHHRSIQIKVLKAIKDVDPDHIFCQLLRTSEYVKHYHNCPKTIDYMDALSLGMERRIATESWWKKPFVKWEAFKLQRYESYVFDYFEHHTMISEQDKAAIIHPFQKKIKVVPNGVSASFFEVLDVKKKYELVFTGNMSYAPNILSCKFLAQDILPKLDSNFKGLISGASPSQDVLQLASSQIEVTGWVEDIRLSYAAGKIFVAPMFIGTGLQNKLLEAMAIGLPCITTSLANNALGAAPGKEVLIAETADEYVSLIQKLLTDELFYNQIANNGRSFVQKKYVWSETVKILKELLE
ncbi:MAG: glycosyltransferase [Crocinitomicaceae bacterium]|nr:glycosyltransferase [Crocinitomicaceae bacterium]